MNKESLKSDISWAVGTIAGVLSLYMVVRIVVGPDTMTRARMGVARGIARTAKAQESLWGDIGRAADTAYWQARNTVL